MFNKNYANKFRKEIMLEIKTSQINFCLCMDQYDRILNSYREANFDVDIQHNRYLNSNNYSNSNSEHIIVMYENQVCFNLILLYY